MTRDDDDFDPEELAEAEALATALDRGHAAEALDEEALQTAALLRYSRDGGALTDARRDAVLDEVLAHADRSHEARAARAPAPWWRRWSLALGLAATLAVAILLVARLRLDPSATELPYPTDSLLSAQLARAAGEDSEAYDGEMRAYRGQVYAALSRRYGE